MDMCMIGKDERRGDNIGRTLCVPDLSFVFQNFLHLLKFVDLGLLIDIPDSPRVLLRRGILSSLWMLLHLYFTNIIRFRLYIWTI